MEPVGVPDTLTLEERAAVAVNALIGMADDAHDGIPFFSGNLLARPAYLSHGDWDYGSSHGRFVDALILARHMCGAGDGAEVEQRYRRNLLAFFGADGLSYRRRNPHRNWEPNANLIDQRAVLLGLTTWYLASGDPAVRAAADRHVAALRRIAVKERDVWYYPASEYTERGWPSANAVQLRLAPDPAAFGGRLIMPLLRYHESTGNGEALELCQFLATMLIARSGVFLPDGSFNDALAFRSGHFHTRLGTLDALARLGRFTGDAALIAFVQRSYAWALGHCTSFGWTPGDLHDQAYEHETCSLVDLIATGITLARSGYRQYWGTVERFLRNHLVECQLMDLDWVEVGADPAGEVPGLRTYRDVARRVRGAFAGYSAPNDFCCDVPYGRGHVNDLQACCLGSGTRGLFLGWSHIVAEEQGLVSVNFLLNRASQWLDVHSHLPHSGRVELWVHQDLTRLAVRIPEWAGYAQVRFVRVLGEQRVEGSGRDPSCWLHQRFLLLPHARAGERITLTFPLPRRRTREEAVGQCFDVDWVGDDVVGISPGGTAHPLYGGRRVLPAAPLLRRPLRAPARELVW